MTDGQTNTAKGSRTGAGLALRSELARLSLPALRPSASRRLAWTNSLCLTFLLTGILGAAPEMPVPRLPPPAEEPIPVLIEPTPPPPPPPATETPSPDAPAPDSVEPSPAVAVALDSPQINFAVPTIGVVVVPLHMAAAPPLTPLKAPAVAKTEVAPPPVTILDTGRSGSRPAPDYPTALQRLEMEGTVQLLLTADAAGRVTEIQVAGSSGHAVLDQHTKDWVRRHWTLPPGEPGQAARAFTVPIRYTLARRH